MNNIDYVNALGAGASFDTKKIVESLVQAERAGAEGPLNRKIAYAEAKISGLGAATSILDILKQGAEQLNDARDFNNLSLSNNQPDAIGAAASTNARAGTNTIAVTSVASEQRSLSQGVSSSSSVLNGGSAVNFELIINGIAHSVGVEDATLESIASALNNAGLGIHAEILDTGVGSDNYRLQLIGETGSSSAFAISSDLDELQFSTVQNASDAELTVNGVDFLRSSNQISDVISGVTLNLNAVTEGNATLTIARDTQAAQESIVNFVALYNEAALEFKNLTDAEQDGPLRGDTIFQGIIRNLRSIVLGRSSSPGEQFSSLSNIGISVDKTGQLLFDEAKLSDALTDNFDDVIQLFSANSNDQSRFNDDPGGIAGDIKSLIERVTSSNGYLVTAEQSLQDRNNDYKERLDEIEERMQKVEERYTRQFLAMQNVIQEMNSTKESLISSFENLPFSNRD
jgi:flagellar hook-associated protein 2